MQHNINVRSTEKLNELIAKAAAALHMNKSMFIRRTLRCKALAILKEIVSGEKPCD